MTDTTPTIEEQRNGAYRERACLLAWLATLCPAVIAPAPDVDEPGWEILYLAPAGQQLTWHIAPADVELFEHVGRAPADDPRVQWDGHTTAEKYERIRGLSAATPPVYEDIAVTRHLGRGITIDSTPEHTRMNLGTLISSPYVHISEVSPGRLLIADQVEYAVTGYDLETRYLTLRLVNDHRPAEVRGEHGPELVHLPRREPGAALADTEDADPNTGLVVAEYRTDQGRKAWVFRCWGDDASGCDGWLALDKPSEAAAIRARDRHVAENHTVPATPSDQEE